MASSDGFQAERAYHVAHRLERMIDDLRVLSAAAGATIATAVCVVALLGFVRLTLREMPYSMAAVIGALADPGSNRNPISVDGRMLLPRPASGSQMPTPGCAVKRRCFCSVRSSRARGSCGTWRCSSPAFGA